MKNWGLAVIAALVVAVVGCGDEAGSSAAGDVDVEQTGGVEMGTGGAFDGPEKNPVGGFGTGGMDLAEDSGTPDCPDRDMDGVCDADDACPDDELDDSDGDGLCDSDDLCPDDAENDSDGDGVCDGVDSCLEGPNTDADGNGYADACDKVLWSGEVNVDLNDVVTQQDLSVLEMGLTFGGGIAGNQTISLPVSDGYEFAEDLELDSIPEGKSLFVVGDLYYENSFERGAVQASTDGPLEYYDTTQWSVRRVSYEGTADGRVIHATIQIRGY